MDACFLRDASNITQTCFPLGARVRYAPGMLHDPRRPNEPRHQPDPARPRHERAVEIALVLVVVMLCVWFTLSVLHAVTRH